MKNVMFTITQKSAIIYNVTLNNGGHYNDQQTICENNSFLYNTVRNSADYRSRGIRKCRKQRRKTDGQANGRGASARGGHDRQRHRRDRIDDRGAGGQSQHNQHGIQLPDQSGGDGAFQYAKCV